MTKRVVGVLVMAYGTPNHEDEIESYYTHIRRGRKPSAEALADLTNRYQAIGGISPLANITKQQAQAIEAQMNALDESTTYRVYIGLKHIAPFIEDALAEMAADGIKQAVTLVLAPHYSTFSVKSYNERALEEANQHGIELTQVEDWHLEPGFIQYWKEAIEDVWQQLSQKEQEAAHVIFSAHSLPEKILQFGDPYPEQLKESVVAIVKATGIEHYSIGWQSEGNTPDPWLGPDVQDLTRTIAEQQPVSAFIYAPIGFISDHLEVLYDNDVECRVVCDELNIPYYRPEMPNTSPLFIEMLAKTCLHRYKDVSSE